MSRPYELIVVGVSAGGMDAITILLEALPQGFSRTIVIVQHLKEDANDQFLAAHFNHMTTAQVCVAEDKGTIDQNHVYLAPAGYHLLIEDDRTFSLNNDPKVNFSRPSIDVLFQSAAFVYGSSLVGILLTGANSDGAAGLLSIHQSGGLTVAQDPDTAEVPIMPRTAINLFKVDHIFSLERITDFLASIHHDNLRR